METTSIVCQSCGREPAREVTVRHHVGLVLLMQFASRRVTACRPCGRRLVRNQTLRTLWMGWWGPISFFFNWFVLAANGNAWRRLRALPEPSLSGEPVQEPPRGFDAPSEPAAEDAAPKRKHRTSPAAYGILGLVVLGLAGWGWDAAHHDHEGEHGLPATVAEIQLAMRGEFVAEDGTTTTVAGAVCTGEGDPLDNGFTHFDCSLAFDDGTGDEVLVHLLPDGELFFKASAGA